MSYKTISKKLDSLSLASKLWSAFGGDFRSCTHFIELLTGMFGMNPAYLWCNPLDSEQDLQESSASSQDLQESSASSQDLQESVALPQDLQESVAPPQVSTESSAPFQVIQESSAPFQVVQESAALPQDLHESTARPQDLHESAVPLQDLHESAVPLQDLQESSVPLQDLLVSSSLSQNVPVSSAPPQDLHESSAPPKDLHESTALPQNLHGSSVLLQDLHKSAVPLQDLPESSAPRQDLQERTAFLQGFQDSSFPLQGFQDSSFPLQDLQASSSPLQDLQASSSPLLDLQESPAPFQDLQESPAPLQCVTESTSQLQHASESSYQLRHASESSSQLRHASESSSQLRHASESSSQLRHASESSSPLRHASESFSPLRHASESFSPLQHASESSSPLHRASESASPLQGLQANSVPPRTFPEHSTQTQGREKDVVPPPHGFPEGDGSPHGFPEGDGSPHGHPEGDGPPHGLPEGDGSPHGLPEGDGSPHGLSKGDGSLHGHPECDSLPRCSSGTSLRAPLHSTLIAAEGAAWSLSDAGAVSLPPGSAEDVPLSLVSATGSSPSPVAAGTVSPAFVLAPIFTRGFALILASATSCAPFRTSPGSTGPSHAFGLSIVRFLLRFCGGSDQVPFDPGRTPGSSSECPGPPSVCGVGASGNSRLDQDCSSFDVSQQRTKAANEAKLQREKSHSPVPSCVSIKSDESMGIPLRFSTEISSPGHRHDPESTAADEFQEKFKSILKKKFECLNGLMLKQENRTLLNEIYTELYITEGESGNVNKEHEVKQIEAASRRNPTEDTPIKCSDIFKPLPEQYKAIRNRLKKLLSEQDEEPIRKVPTKLLSEQDEKPIWRNLKKLLSEQDEEPIRNCLKKLLSEQDEEHIRTALTKGVAGIGKTVSVQKFVLDWAEGKTNQDVHLIFPLPFRELNLMTEQKLSLVELLHVFFKEMKEMDISRLEKVLFIFDGLDECRFPLDFQKTVRVCDVTKSAPVHVLLINLIKGNLLPSALIWITSRPAAAGQIPSECVHRVTEVRGFNDPQKEEYFRKKISDQNMAKKIITHLKSLRSLYIMCHIPVFCWISAAVLERMLGEAESGEIPKTLTQMYTHFLIIQTNIIREKYLQKQESNEEMLLKLGKLAFQQLEKQNLIFYEEDLIVCGIDVAEAAVYSGVCTQIFREEFGLHQSKVYCFVHLSIQEYLAALYVHLTFMKKRRNVLEPNLVCRTLSDVHRSAVDQALYSQTGHLDLFLRFLLGLSLDSNQKLLHSLVTQTGRRSQSEEETVQYIKKKISKSLPTEKSINLFHCLNELGDDSLVKEIQHYLKFGAQSKLSPSQWSALVFVLLTSAQDLEEFDLNKYITPDKIRDKILVRVMPVIAASRKAIIRCNEITKRSSVEALSSVLNSETSSLRELHLTVNTLKLSWNKLEDSGVKRLSALLENPQCKVKDLRLCDCGVSDEGCAALTSALKSNPSHLRLLYLSWNNVGDPGVKCLSAVLENPHCKLEILRGFGSDFQLHKMDIIRYDRDTLIYIGVQCTHLSPFLNSDPCWLSKVLRENKGRHPYRRPQGKRAGVRNRLRACTHRAPLPSIQLANVQSLENKLDRARVKFQWDIRNCNLLCEVCSPECPSGTFQSIISLSRSCTVNLELLTIKCRPFYLPRVGSVIVSAIYIPPQADTDTAVWDLHETKTLHQTQHRKAALIVVGDFTVPTSSAQYLIQHITCPTRSERTLDHCYTPFKNSYKAQSRPLFGKSGPCRHLPHACIQTKAETGSSGSEDELNTFYTRYEAAANHASAASGTNSVHAERAGEVNTFTISEQAVRRAFKRVNTRKAAGPDSITGLVLKACADQLAPVLTEIFNLLLEQSVVPSCFKQFTTVRVPKKPQLACLNVYRTVALTSVVMKCFERLTDHKPYRWENTHHSPSALELQGCVLSPLLYSLYTYDCVATSNSTTIIKFADDTVVVSLISNNNETAYLQDVKNLEKGCQENNLLLNVSKTKELIVAFITK
ncbi:NACHT, LRR and PYD domains-containing protein 12-like [Silurus meridionalis]|nr:NACHT, LRR and PYD domains-containing protein 12-like [Silurus meridionalis]